MWVVILRVVSFLQAMIDLNQTHNLSEKLQGISCSYYYEKAVFLMLEARIFLNKLHTNILIIIHWNDKGLGKDRLAGSKWPIIQALLGQGFSRAEQNGSFSRASVQRGGKRDWFWSDGAWCLPEWCIA